MNQLPKSEAAEQSLLGCILLKPELMGWIEASERSFYDPKNIVVWQAFVALQENEVAIDEITVEVELNRVGKLEAVGGLAYISRLALSCATAANVESYLKTLEDFRVTREVMLAVSNAQALAERDGIRGEEMLDGILSELAGVKRKKINEATAVSETITDIVKRIMVDAEAIKRGGAGTSYFESGIGTLDGIIDGFPFATVSCIGGRPGEGKSSTLLKVCENAARIGLVAVIFTTEDPRDRWNERLLADHANLPVDRIYARKLEPFEMSQALEAATYLRDLTNLHIVHAHGMTAVDMTRIATGMGAQVIGIDYAQKVVAPEPRMKLHDSIEASSKIFGDYAGKSGAAVIILSQLSKDIEKDDRRPNKSDLRYGDGLAQEAKLIVLLHDPKNDSRKMLREMLIAKRNQGARNEIAEVLFDGEHCRFIGAGAMKSDVEF